MEELAFDPKVILVTGAGASVPLGMPTAAAFLDVLRRNESINQQYLEEAISASSSLVTKTQAQVVDVESLLDHLASFITGLPSILAESVSTHSTNERELLQHLAEGYAELREQIFKSIVDIYGEVDATKTVPLLHALTFGLAKCFDINVLPVFTLNYDLAFETYIDNMRPSAEMIDGFDRSPSALIRRWSREIFSKSLVRPLSNETELRVLLFKLHGSANWGRDSRTRELHQIGFVPRDTGRYETVLYYPSNNQKPTYQEPFQTAFDYFLKSVTRAEAIVIIGTSFRDKPVTEILLRARPDCRIVICNHSENEPKFVAELRAKIPDVSYIGGDIGQPSTRYAIISRATSPFPRNSRRMPHKLGLPIIDSIPFAGLYRAGKWPAIVVEADIVSNHSRDWYLVQEGRLRHIPDIPTFNALGFIKNTLSGTPEISASLPEGDPLPSLASDLAIIQKPDTDDIFIILEGRLCHIEDVPALEAFRDIGLIQSMRNYSADTFRTMPIGEQIGLHNFEHRNLDGNVEGATKAPRSILKAIESPQNSWSSGVAYYEIKERLKFFDERILRILVYRLLDIGAVTGDTRHLQKVQPQFAIYPIARINDLPYDLALTEQGRELLAQWDGANPSEPSPSPLLPTRL